MGTHSEVAEDLGEMMKFILKALGVMAAMIVILIALVIYLVVKL